MMMLVEHHVHPSLMEPVKIAMVSKNVFTICMALSLIVFFATKNPWGLLPGIVLHLGAAALTLHDSQGIEVYARRVLLCSRMHGKL